MKQTFLSRLPRSIVPIVWALAAVYWRDVLGGAKKPTAGATYRGLAVLLGLGSSSANMRRLVKKAEASGAVVIRHYAHRGASLPEAGCKRPFISLTHSTLEALEELWRRK